MRRAEARLLSLLKHKFKNKLYSLDASTIDRCLNVFPWANANIYKARWQIELFFKWILNCGEVTRHNLVFHPIKLP